MFETGEFDREEIRVNQKICSKQNGRIALLVEHCVEAATVQVRILFRPQTTASGR